MISVAQLIDNQAILNPDKIAIKHGDRTFTYKEVSTISNQLARFFKDQNITTGDVIAIAIDRSPEMVIALIAVMKAGATYLPIDNNFPAERIDYMLDDSSAKLVIKAGRLREQAEYSQPTIFIEDAWSACSKYDTSDLPSTVDNDSIVYILYTSGSTGKPKGVQVKYRGLVNFLLSMQKAPGITADDIVLATTTISFDIAELEVFLPLISGALLVVANSETVRDGRALLDIARGEKITIMQGTPFMWRTMIEAEWDDILPLKILCGGEAMSMELAKQLVTRCNELWNMYGPTETTIWSLIKRISVDDELITIGDAIDNTQVYILDDAQNEVAKGTVGELCIGGDGVAKGYLNRPELTAEKFIDDKFTGVAGEKVYRTGDLGKVLDNGEILCMGRLDHQIKIRGYRIETEEIEHQLKQQENVNNALIILYKDALENSHLVAYIVPEKAIERDNTNEYIKKWKVAIGLKLPEYMVPTIFMVINAIPLMANGKVDRNALPAPVNQQSLTEYEAPKTETEIALAAIFLKKVAIEKIGINDNFFELGINSLIAVSIMVQVEKQFGKRLPLSMLLKYPTIKQLALLILDDKPDSPYTSLVPIKPGGNKLPVYIIHGIGLNLLNLYNLVSHLDAEQPVYGLQAIGLDGTMELPGSMEEIAQFYNEEIIKHDPSGPYLIAGYSFGGYIAFEMVRQLQAMGKEVRLLAMFDTNLQEPAHQRPFLEKFNIKMIRQFKKLGFRLSTLFTQPLATLDYLKNDYTIEFKLFLNRIGIIKDYHPEDLPDYMQDIAGELYSAFHNYKVKPNHVKIDLFKAGTRLYYIDNPEYLGWKEYALDGVKIYNVPGDHKDMFGSDNSKIFAGVLQTRLNEVNT